jgi:hypothetical protein
LDGSQSGLSLIHDSSNAQYGCMTRQDGRIPNGIRLFLILLRPLLLKIACVWFDGRQMRLIDQFLPRPWMHDVL